MRRLREPSPPPPAPAPDPETRKSIKRVRSQSPDVPQPPVVRSKYSANVDSRSHAALDRVHSSHHMFTHRGLAWCGRCGCVMTYLGRRVPALRHLSKLCQYPTFDGARTLRELHSSPIRLPHGIKQWPEDAMNDWQQQLPQGQLKV